MQKCQKNDQIVQKARRKEYLELMGDGINYTRNLRDKKYCRNLFAVWCVHPSPPSKYELLLP